jgi:hypothetical protein
LEISIRQFESYQSHIENEQSLSRWTSYLRNDPADENYYSFFEYTRTLIKDNVNVESTVYGRLPKALSAVERELPEAPDDVRANIFCSEPHEGVHGRIKLPGIISLPNSCTEMIMGL